MCNSTGTFSFFNARESSMTLGGSEAKQLEPVRTAKHRKAPKRIEVDFMPRSENNPCMRVETFSTGRLRRILTLPPERRSPTRQVLKSTRKRAGSEIGAPRCQSSRGQCQDAPFYHGPAFLRLIISSNKSTKVLLKFTSHWWFNSISHMKRLLILGIGLAVLLSASLVSHAAQTAQARIFCLSLRLQRGPDMFDL